MWARSIVETGDPLGLQAVCTIMKNCVIELPIGPYNSIVNMLYPKAIEIYPQKKAIEISDAMG